MGASSLVRGILPRIYGGPPHPDGPASHTFTARNAASHPMGAPLSSESTDGMLCALPMTRETDGARRGWNRRICGIRPWTVFSGGVESRAAAEQCADVPGDFLGAECALDQDRRSRGAR